MVAHVGKFQRQHTCFVARQCHSVGSHVKKYGAPTVHTCFRPVGVIVGYDEINLHLVSDTVSKLVGNALGTFELFATRHQMLAVLECPRIELGVRKFDVLRTHCFGHLQNLPDVVDVEPMQHHVEHHGILVLLDELGDLGFQIERSRAGQEVIHFPCRILERQLNLTETAFLESGNAFFGQANT